MRKFKHKKLGYIAELCENNVSYKFNVGNSTYFMLPELLENSNDWEEIKEYPKIIAFKRVKSTDCKLKGELFTLQNNGAFKSNVQSVRYSINEKALLHDDDCVDSGHFIIYQVATSETEIFTIGDSVKYSGEKCSYDHFVIDHFFHNNHGLLLARDKNHTKVEYVTEIKKVDVRKALFTTEDGIIICEGDVVWFVENENVWETKAVDHKGKFHDTTDTAKRLKSFSTKDAAEKYVDKYQLKFSKNDILSAINSACPGHVDPSIIYVDTLKMLLKL